MLEGRALSPHRIASLRLPLAAAFVLAACSSPEEKQAGAAPPVPAAEALAPPPAPEATVGGDGSPITLNGLSPADLEANALSGELGCSFSTADERQPLLLAMGDVASKETAQGLVKVGDYVERIGAPGGFDGMLKGPTFSGAGKTIRIALTGPPTGGGESPPRPATLTYERADGASRTFIGSWTCGP